MENIVGIFRAVTDAEQAVVELISRDIPEESLTFLSRERPRNYPVRKSSENELESVKTTPAESSGKGKTSGAVLGATIGGAAGFTAGATAASLMIPGFGVVFAIGLGAAALLGVGGAAAGAKAGDATEQEIDKGASKDQVQFYLQLLRRGLSLVIANVRSGADISTVREGFRKYNSEDAETVRRELRSAA
jgi:hypothetical protein